MVEASVGAVRTGADPGAGQAAGNFRLSRTAGVKPPSRQSWTHSILK